MDDDRIRLLLDESRSGSGYEDENDSEVEDNVEVQEETYDTEQDDDNDEIFEEDFCTFVQVTFVWNML